jgi:hypothetical protein
VTRWRDRLVGLGAVEAIAVGTAVAMPLTPTKTGSTWSPAELFWPDPSYLQKVFVGFVLANILLFALGLVAWLVSTLRR